MQIRRLSLAEGARAAEGLAVVIDVFRAFTCEPLMFHCGARRIILEGDPDACRAFREIDPAAVLVGDIVLVRSGERLRRHRLEGAHPQAALAFGGAAHGQAPPVR